MITLPIKFNSGRGGFGGNQLNYKQLRRTNNLCLYERRNNDGTLKDYEVFETKVTKAGTVFFEGMTPTEEDKESYASTNDWGKTAWTFKELDRANNKFDLLLNPPIVNRPPVIWPKENFTIKEFQVLNNLNTPYESKKEMENHCVLIGTRPNANPKLKPANLYKYNVV
jgi:hypothetical protein